MDTTAAPFRILVVDDEQNVRAVLCHYLREANFETLEAADGAQAIEAARARKPDIVLLDLTMPNMDGLVACAAIKKDLPQTQVIICTARTGRQDLVRAIQAGADDYIAKPFRREIVLAKVARARDRGLTPRPTHSPIAHERRGAPRRPTRWTVSWQSVSCHSAFKCRVLDISLKGLAFEFPGCQVCMTSDHGAADHFPKNASLDLLLAISTDVLLEAGARIAYSQRLADRPSVEKVGVEFTDLPAHAATVIQEFVDGKLDL